MQDLSRRWLPKLTCLGDRQAQINSFCQDSSLLLTCKKKWLLGADYFLEDICAVIMAANLKGRLLGTAEGTTVHITNWQSSS